MNYRRIECFLAVVDAGTVTAAAENIHIAQPALSRQVKKLERELRFPLFEARGNRLVLTAAGRAFVPAARRLMIETRGLEGAAEALRTGRVSTLVLAATAASVRTFIAPFIATTGADDPIILTRETRHFDIPHSLAHGADFAVSPAPPAADLESASLGNIALKAFVAADHPWALEKRETLPISALRDEDVIVPSRQSVSRVILDNAMNRSRLSFARMFECEDGQTIMALAVGGHGVGITTEMPRYGAHPLRLVEQTQNTDDAPRVLQLPLHVTWSPRHFAALTIRALALRIRAFLEAHEIA
ncbi:LysR family transcriptional regulator [Salinisphaera aquimarina]|uniref:LysR family transcriptional regulator n=1 Tax=Salinisphaera aquimarina TaxID=2094031 RepID=A0ABV7ELF9_9GAMM